MKTQHINIHGIPIIYVDQEQEWNELLNHVKPKKIMFLSHGLYSKKEDNIKELELLAQNGLTAIGIDNYAHGERSQDLNDENHINQCIERSAHDIIRLIDFFQTKCRCKLGFGMMGISLGGMITYMVASLDPRLEVAVPILGRPDWPSINSPHLRSQDFKNCKMLVITAGKDVNVPPESSREFYYNLKQFVAHSPDQFQYIEYSESSHFMREQDWFDAMNNLEAFLSKWNARI